VGDTPLAAVVHASGCHPRPGVCRGTVVVAEASDGRTGNGVVAGSLWELVPYEDVLHDGDSVEVVEAYESFLVVKHADNPDFS
jgi:hypothetical protein